MKIVTCALVTIFIVHSFIRRQYNILDAFSSFFKTSFFAIFLYLFKVEHAGGAAKLIIKNHQNRQNVGKQCLINLQRIFFFKIFSEIFPALLGQLDILDLLEKRSEFLLPVSGGIL